MVFSVQHGEHGPLVVYKLKVPTAPDSVVEKPVTASPPPLPLVPLEDVVIRVSRQAAPAAAPSQEPTPPRLSPLEPTILGTVVMPASWNLAPQPPAPKEVFSGVRLAVPTYEEVTGIAAESQAHEVMVNEDTGDFLTLHEVHEAVIWRRGTIEKLRQVPVTPRF